MFLFNFILIFALLAQGQNIKYYPNIIEILEEFGLYQKILTHIIMMNTECTLLGSFSGSTEGNTDIKANY